jgi:linoleoyl-CoA desaturase
MKTVRFEPKDKRLFAAAVRRNVNNYFKENEVSAKGGASMIFKVVVMLSMYLAPFILMLTVPMDAWVIFPLSVLMGIGMAGIGMSVMHDAVHGSLSKRSWMNKLLGSTIYMLGGNVFTWKVQHNLLHHTYTNIDGMDEDIGSKVMFRFSKHAPLRKMHRFQHIYAFGFYSLMTVTKLINDFFSLRKYNKKGYTENQKTTPTKELILMIASKAIYLFVCIGLPLLLSGFSWWIILLGFLAMHLTAGMIMSIVFQLAHLVEETEQPMPDEKGVIENEWAIHEMETTANFGRKSRIMNWFIGGLNFQIEHHLFPNVSHIHYKKIAPIVERTAQEFGIPYIVNPSFVHAVRSHVRVLKRLGRH